MHFIYGQLAPCTCLALPCYIANEATAATASAKTPQPPSAMVATAADDLSLSVRFTGTNVIGIGVSASEGS
jgi:hypothetical protein